MMKHFFSFLLALHVVFAGYGQQPLPAPTSTQSQAPTYAGQSSFKPQWQQPFEGRIDYLMTNTDSTIRIFLSCFFGEEKILVQMRVMKGAGNGSPFKNETLRFDFRNGYLDRIHDSAKIIQREFLAGPDAKRDLTAISPTTDTMSFLGYPATASATSVSKEEMKDSVKVKVSAQLKIWYATSLFFPVPDEMKMVQMVPLLTNGNVALGSTISIAAGPVRLQLTTRAVEIRPGKLGPAIFNLPAGYKIEQDDHQP